MDLGGKDGMETGPFYTSLFLPLLCLGSVSSLLSVIACLLMAY